MRFNGIRNIDRERAPSAKKAVFICFLYGILEFQVIIYVHLKWNHIEHLAYNGKKKTRKEKNILLISEETELQKVSPDHLGIAKRRAALSWNPDTKPNT